MTDAAAPSADATPTLVIGDAPQALSSGVLPPPGPEATTTLEVLPGTLPTPVTEPNNLGDVAPKPDAEIGLGTDAPSGPAAAGMDPSAERILISIGSIGKICLHPLLCSPI